VLDSIGERVVLPPLDITKPINATAPPASTLSKIVLSLAWARFTPAGVPAGRGPRFPAKAAEVDNANATKVERIRIFVVSSCWFDDQWTAIMVPTISQSRDSKQRRSQGTTGSLSLSERSFSVA
jgi:hypothetical protein